MGIPTSWRMAAARPPAAFALAIALSVVAFALLPLVGRHLGPDPVLMLALPVVVLSAWAGGFWPGMLAAALMASSRIGWGALSGSATFTWVQVLRSAIALPSALVVCAGFEQVHRARRRAEARAQEAESAALASQHLAAALNALPISVFDMDCELRYVRTLSSAMGLKSDQMKGKRAEDLFDAQTAAQLTRLRRDVLAGGQPRRAEVEYHGAGGWHCMEVFATPLRSEAGQVVGLTNVVVDISEKKQREIAEREAQLRMHRLVDSAAVAIAFSSSGVITEANDAFLALMGYSRGDLRAGRIHQGSLVPPDERGVYAMAKQELDETGRNGPFRAVLLRADGLRVDVITSAGRLADNDYCIFFTDISALVRAERALRISEERFRSLVNATASIVWTAGPQREFVTEQASWADYTGQTREQYGGFGWLDALHPDDRAGALEDWRQAAEARQPYRGRARLWHQASGGYRRALARANPVLRDGQIVEWVGMVFDIEEGERVSERLQLLVEDAPLAVIEFDGELRVTRWAGQAETLFGWRADEVVGRAADELPWLPDDAPQGAQALRALLAGPVSRTRFRMRNRRSDGRLLHAEWSVSALRPSPSAPSLALLALVLDVTEREQALESLRHADRQKDNFIATLAHELRNPLAPIANGARLLTLKPDDAKTVSWLAQAIERQVRQLTRLLDDLLDVSRISRNVLQIQRERVHLREAIELAAEQVRPFIEAQGHRLEMQLSPEPMLLMGDMARLTQVVANLLHNAAKYTPEPGLIRLTAAPHGTMLQLTVQDSGLGIAAEEQQRVFEMFSQAHAHLRSAQPGLGIGLALVKGIVEIHGGSVLVASEGPGRGSCFTVMLPALAEPQALAHPLPQGPASVTGHRVLVVDDNVDSAQSIGALMSQWGNEVQVVFGAQAALDAGAGFQPQVVLMDIGMPGIDGLQAARMMRGTAWGRAAVLVAMTGYGQPEDKRRALQAGFDHHLTKPVDLELLAACMQQR